MAEVGIGFCFAPVFHPAMRYAGRSARELGVPTAMNVLGPLTNPAQPAAGLVGCADTRLAPVMAEVFAGRGASVLVVRGDDGLDELTTTTTSTVWVVGGGEVRTRERWTRRRSGVPVATREDLRGGDPARNAEVFRALVAGEHGPVRDAVLLNAAGALVAFDGVPARRAGGRLRRRRWQRAAAAVDSGAAAALLERWVGARPRACAARPDPSRPAPPFSPGRRENAASVSRAAVGAERDVGVGAPHALDLAEPAGDHVGELRRARAP